MKQTEKSNISENKVINNNVLTDIKKKDNTAKTIVIVAVIIAIVAVVSAVLIVMLKGSGNINKHLNLGNKYLDEMKFEEAIAEFERVIEIDPMNTEAYLGIADAYVGIGDYQSAIDILDSGIDNGVEGLNDKLDEVMALLVESSGPVNVTDGITGNNVISEGESTTNGSGTNDLNPPITNGTIRDEVSVSGLLASAVIEGKHISEWSVDELIEYYGLEYNGSNYQSVGGDGTNYQVAYKNEGGDSYFDWYTIERDGNYHFSENTNGTSGLTYYEFGYSEGDNMPFDGGLAGYASDNGMNDADGFLRALGLSDDIISEMRNSYGTEFTAYEKKKDGTITSWSISISQGGIDGNGEVYLWTNGVSIRFNSDISRKVWISYGPGKDDIANWRE